MNLLPQQIATLELVDLGALGGAELFPVGCSAVVFQYVFTGSTEAQGGTQHSA